MPNNNQGAFALGLGITGIICLVCCVCCIVPGIIVLVLFLVAFDKAEEISKGNTFSPTTTFGLPPDFTNPPVPLLPQVPNGLPTPGDGPFRN